MTNTFPFIKASGLGNDFVIIDNRQGILTLPTPTQIRHLADRRQGIGCDQLIVIETSSQATASVRFFNADGSEAEACGNGTRGVAKLLLDEGQINSVTLLTPSGPLTAKMTHVGVSVNMGSPILEPLTDEQITSLPLPPGLIRQPVKVNVGNPHIVFFVEDIQAVPVNVLGPKIEHHSLFPNRINVGFAQIISPETLHLIVWERGAGLTLACGTGACAAAVAAASHGHTSIIVSQKGGDLSLSRDKQNNLWMTGPAEVTFTGQISLSNKCNYPKIV